MAKYDMRTDERFYQRRSIEDFTSEHEMVEELYNIIAQQPGIKDKDLKTTKSNALYVMNGAFYLCMLFEQAKKTTQQDEIINYIEYVYRGYPVKRQNVLSVAITLLSLYDHDRVILRIKAHYPISLNYPELVPAAYAEIVNCYHGKVKLDFSGKQKKHMLENAYDYLSLDEKIATTLKMVDKIKHERKEEIQEKDARIQALEAEVEKLQQTIDDLQNQTNTATPSIDEEDEAVNKVINYKTICEYAVNLPAVNETLAQAILDMLVKIAFNKSFTKDNYKDYIDCSRKAREEKLKGKNSRTIINHNNNSQVFNGTINGASFDKKAPEKA